MEDNSLLVIVLAFIVGCMCSGMMKQMCGNKTYGSQMVPHRSYNTCNRLIEGSTNGENTFEIDTREDGCFPAHILYDDGMSFIEFKRDVANITDNDYFIRGYGRQAPSVGMVDKVQLAHNNIMFKYNKITYKLTRNQLEIDGYKYSVIYVHYPNNRKILVYPNETIYSGSSFPYMMLDDSVMNFRVN